MGELRRYIKSNNLIMRVVSLVLAVTVLASALVYFGDENMPTVSAAEGKTKQYMEYIVQRLIDGAQEEFNVLEIVPYIGQGEFRYYASDSEVEQGLEDRQDYLEELYKTTGRNKKSDGSWDKMDQWFKINEPYSNFNYEIRYNSETKKFEVKAPYTFVKNVVPQYEDLITEKINVNTVEANKITMADIQKADLIIISTGTHDNNTIAAYREFTNDRTKVVYDKKGNIIEDTGSITYNTFEKVKVEDLPKEEETKPVITKGMIYFKNTDNWSNVNVYYWNDGTDELVQWPGTRMNLVEGETDVFSAEIPSNAQYVLFTNGSSFNSPTLKFEGFDKGYNGEKWVKYPFSDTPEEEPDSSTDEPTGDSTGDGTDGSTGETTPKDEYAYVTRDMSWSMCEKLLDYLIIGKDMEMPGGTVLTGVKTPVIIDNGGISQLNKDSNIYKMMLIYRMCGADRWEFMKSYLSTTDASGNKYINTDGATTVAVDLTGKGFTKDSLISWNVGNDNTVKKLFDSVANGKKFDEYRETEPFSSDHLTDDYWVYTGASWIIPNNVNATINASGKNFTDRIGDKTNKAIDVMRYLLGCKSTQVYSFTDKVRVLEIQPCNCYEYKSLDKIKELGKKLLRKDYNKWTNDGKATDYRNYITIDYVTPNALNGMTVDIASEYDLVIIGDNIGSTKDTNRLTQADGKTIYNDRGLNGYIYLAFGDILKLSTYALGYLPNEYFQTNNNQGTTVNASKQHLWTPYLYKSLTQGKNYVVKDMKYYYVTDTTVQNSLRINKGKNPINNEKLYMEHELGNTRIADNDITNITKEKLISYVETGNPIIVADSIYYADDKKIYPTSDMYDFAKNTLGDLDSRGERANKNVLRKDAMGTAVAFLGTKAPKITFVNGQVKYIKRSEDNVYSTVTETRPVKPVEPEYLGDTDGSGGVICTFNNRELHYKFNITGQVGKKYIVKLLVDKNNDGVFKDVGSGVSDDSNEVYYAKEVTLNKRTVTYQIDSALADNFVGMLAWKIDIIQLDDDGEETVYRVSEKGYSAIRNDDNRPLRVLQIIPKGATDGANHLLLDRGTFKTLMDQVKSVVGYNMQVTTKTVTQYASEYGGANYNKLITNFDMIVIGFADSFGGQDINNDNGAMQNLIKFMDAGKAVLFTHDTVSYRSSPTYKSGYKNGNSYSYLSSFKDVNSQGNDASTTAYGNVCFNLTINLRAKVGMDKYGVTLDLTPQQKEALGYDVPKYATGAYKPTYMGTDNYVREIQGFNDWNTFRMSFLHDVTTKYESKGNNYTSLTKFATLGKLGSMYTTSEIVQLNEGPITMYPYNVGAEVPISNTHGQYFELNMEDEDIVVWYTLDANSGYFSKSYKDAGNNYYIYSKNNITYSGAGHSDMKSTSSLELKLFVNTIVKAIAGGNSEPVITITNGGEVFGAEGTYVAYVNSSDSPDNYEIDFKAEDADLVAYETTGGNMDIVGEFTKAEIFWEKSDGTEKSIKLYQAEYDANGKKIKSGLKNGIIQEFKLGDTNLTKEEKEAIKNAVISGTGAKFRIQVQDSVGATDSVYVKLLVRDLFEMD